MRDHVERAAQRRRARVVGVVDQRDAAAQPRRPRRGDRPGEAARRRRRCRRARCRIERDGRGREHVRQIAASEQRRFDDALAGRRRHARAHAVDAAVLDRRGADRRALSTVAEGHDPADERRAPAPSRADRLRCRPARVPASARSRISAFASAIASGDAKKPRCASPTFVHTRTSGVGNRDQRADLPGVIHPQFHHRDVRPVAQLHQRQRQTDVVVQIPLVLHHRESRGQERRDGFLRRRLSRAARDRDHLRRDGACVTACARSCSAAACRPLRIASGVLLHPAALRRSLQPHRRASTSATNACPSNRGPRSATKRSPARSVRLSVTTSPTARSATVPLRRPPTAPATQPSVKFDRRHTARDFTSPRRQCLPCHLDVVE